MRRTYGVSLNTRNPAEAALLEKLEAAGNQSDLIKRALLAYFTKDGPTPVITEQELGELRAQLAWHKQNGVAPVAATRTSPSEPTHDQSGRLELSEGFKAAIIKAARPGLRLEI